jgi:hypothetical protein
MMADAMSVTEHEMKGSTEHPIESVLFLSTGLALAALFAWLFRPSLASLLCAALVVVQIGTMAQKS